MQTKIRIPLSSRIWIQVSAFGILCTLLGMLLCFFIMTKLQVDKLNELVVRERATVEKLDSTFQYFRVWKGLVDEQFIEQSSAIRRLEFLGKIPMHERTDAAELYDAFNNGGR